MDRRTVARRVAVVTATTLVLAAATVLAAVPVRAGASTTRPRPASSITVFTNLCYEPGPLGGCTDGTAHTFDAYLPAWPGDAPAVILIHPGSHKAGDKSDVANIAEALANDGFVAFSINYRLDTPTVPGFPMQIQDVQAATAYLRQHAATFNAVPNQFALLGFSAGADLALIAGLQAQIDNPAAQAQVLAGWSGGYDYTGAGGPALNPGQAANVEQYLGCSDLTAPACQATATVASATTWVRPGDPPSLLANSTDWQQGCEVTNPLQAENMASDLQAAGNTVQLDLNDECAHANAYADVQLGPTVTFLQAHLSTVPVTLRERVVSTAALPDGQGYWQVAADGGIFAFGQAGFYGSTGGLVLNRPTVGMAATPDGRGYWLVAADGGIFSFGDAGFYGSTGGMQLNRPIVGMAATPDGRGYWLVAADGGIFSFGDAGFYGSTGGMQLNRPIVGMAATPDGRGYWLVAADGGVFSFGDAGYFGTTAALTPPPAVVGMSTTPDGRGYRLASSTGSLFTFGDATSFGSLGPAS